MSDELKPEVRDLRKKIEHLEERRLDHIEAQLQDIIDRQRDMEKQLTRYSARWGLLFMVGTAVVAAVKLLWQDISRFLRL